VSTDNYKIELFIFPDGMSVELMVFDRTRSREAAAPAPTVQPAVAAAQCSTSAAAPPKAAPAPCRVPPPPLEDGEAHRCPVCDSELVYPTDWDRSGQSSWTLHLRCPECETRREVTVGRAGVEQLNRELYFGAQALAREADQMMRRNFEDEVDRIVIALERDLILPMDF
jgi:hypothetical protein